MAQTDTYAQIIFSVEGIQATLLATGKLGDMICGRDLTTTALTKAITFCQNDLRLSEATQPGKANDWFIILQQDATILRLLVPSKDLGKQVVNHVSLWVLENCPQLPILGACRDFAWTAADLSTGYAQARSILNELRVTKNTPFRSVWPFSRVLMSTGAATIDTTTNTKADIAENVSLQKITQDVHEALIKQKYITSSTDLAWCNDLNVLLNKSRAKKSALLHIDINDCGKLYGKISQGKKSANPTDLNKEFRGLDAALKDALDKAFVKALLHILPKNSAESKGKYVLPICPIMFNNTDLTVLILADVALNFVDHFAASFEAITKEQGHPTSIGAGVVMMPRSYPFSRACKLVEDLTSNAKRFTAQEKSGVRQSSVDYLILTNDIDSDIDAMRDKSYTSRDGCLLTAKPFICGKPWQITPAGKAYVPDQALSYVLADAELLHNILPTGQLREAIDLCRTGRAQAKRAWGKLRDNLMRGLGTSKDSLASFDRIFPKEFFFERNKVILTLLGDYLELRHLFARQEEN